MADAEVEVVQCLSLSSPALNDLIDFMVSSSLTGCQCIQFICHLRGYLHNKPVDETEKQVVTGSRAEGIDRASDDDLMFVNHNLCVVNQHTTIADKDKEICYFTAVLDSGYIPVYWILIQTRATMRSSSMK